MGVASRNGGIPIVNYQTFDMLKKELGENILQNSANYFILKA
ncbi:hypothetical protein AEQU2_00228 [Aequorivita lipolytica]|nr:hypothetical protein AEQU2_00228 [Aequorivita lipolytica]